MNETTHAIRAECHDAAAQISQMGMVVRAEENVIYAVSRGNRTKKTAHVCPFVL